MWPLPYGVSYNSYLIVDEKTVLVDTVDVCYSDIFLKKIADALDGRPLDFLIVNHMEPDHAGSIRLLRQQYPDVQIVGNKQTFGMLNGYHGISTGLYEVKEGDTLSVGRHQLSFYMAPMVHWPEVMVTYDSTDKILFSADAFGTYGTLDGGVIDSEMNVEHYWEEMLRYYSNIVGKYGNPVQRALQKLSALDIRTICSTHGPVWREYAAKAIDIYDRMSRYEGEEGVTIVYGSMYGNTEQMAEAIAASLAANGVKNIVMHNVSKSPASYVLKDIFKYKGLIIGSPTYSNRLFPEIESILDKIETGIALHGTEVKSLRMGKCSIKESFIRIENGEVFIYGMHISPYEKGNIFNKDPLRTRKLLLHKSEISKMIGQINQKGYTLIPLKVYFSGSLVKVQIGLCKGKKLYDKRQDISKRDQLREAQRDFKVRNFG